MRTQDDVKTFKKIKRSFAHIFLSMCLLHTSIWLSTPVAYGQADNPVEAQAEAKVKEEQDDIQRRNENNAEANTTHDDLAGDKNLSYCKTLSDNTSDKYDNMEEFSETYSAQLLDEIDAQRDKLKAEGNILTNLEDKIRTESGGQVSTATKEMGFDIADKMKLLEKEMKRLVVERNRLKIETQQKKAAYESIRYICDDHCTQPQRSRIAAARSAWKTTEAAWQKAEADYKKAYHDYHYAGKPLQSQEGNIAGAHGDMVAGDAENEAGAFAQSGCPDPCTELTGPLYEQNEALQSLINKSTNEAARLAQIKVERLKQLELQNSYSADFRLFEMAMQKMDPGVKFYYDEAGYKNNKENGFTGPKMAISNMEVMAHAGAAAKNLRCVPINEKGNLLNDYYDGNNYKNKYGDDYADSKAYHLFRAASATYLSAQINDTAYFANSSDCRAFEDFTGDDKDTQIRTVERAANMYDQVFASLCLRINPTDTSMKAECDAHVEKILGVDDKYKNMARTRENALEMFKAADTAALKELENKMRLVAEAYANVQKGKARVKEYTRKLKITIAIMVMAEALVALYQALSSACCGAIACPPCGGLLALLSIWQARLGVYVLLVAYYQKQIARWKSFVKKWEKKLEQARVHTHLACNEDPAKEETKKIKKFADNAKVEAQKSIDEAKSKVLKEISKKFEGIPNATPAQTLNIDYRTRDRIRRSIAHSQNGHDTLILINDGLRLEKGAVSSLAYDAKLPSKKEVVTLQDSFMKNPIQITQMQIWGEKVLDLIFPKAHALLTAALGVAYGSEAFHYFLISRNRAWYLQAQDVTPHVNLKTNGAPVDLAPLDSMKDYTHVNYEKGGFPIPETRIITTRNMVAMVTENIALLNMSLAEAKFQRDSYVMLLENMKTQFKLGIKGTDDIVQLPPKIVKVHCSVEKNGVMTVDATCACKANNSCAAFSYPSFGDWGGNVADSANLAEDVGNKTFKGDLEGADLAGAELAVSNKALGKYRRDVTEKFTKAAVAAGQTPLDIDKAAASLRENTLQNNFKAFAIASPLLAEFEQETNRKKFGKAGGDLNSVNKLSKGKSSKDSKKLKKPTYATKGGDKSGKKYDKSGDKESWEFGFQDVNLDNNLEAAMRGKGNSGKNGKNGKDKDKNNYYQGHSRGLSDSKSYDDWKNGVHTDKKKSLFTIISKRYKRTAYPIFEPSL